MVILRQTAKMIFCIKSRNLECVDAECYGSAWLRWTSWKISRSLDPSLPLALHPNLLELWAKRANVWRPHHNGLRGVKKMKKYTAHSRSWISKMKNHGRKEKSMEQIAMKSPDSTPKRGYFWQNALRKLLGQGNQWTSRGQQTQRLLAWLKATAK